MITFSPLSEVLLAPLQIKVCYYIVLTNIVIFKYVSEWNVSQFYFIQQYNHFLTSVTDTSILNKEEDHVTSNVSFTNLIYIFVYRKLWIGKVTFANCYVSIELMKLFILKPICALKLTLNLAF